MPESEPSSPWLLGPWFDLLFVANVPWVLALAPGFVLPDGQTPLTFWQVYFLTTPHRWITLFVVLADPQRREGRVGWLIGIAVAAAVVVLLAWWAETADWIGNGLACLATVDLLWNGWHFASQHAGILRLYARKTGPGQPWFETWAIRGLVFAVTLRLVGWLTGWLEASDLGDWVLAGVDIVGGICLSAAGLWLWGTSRWSREPGKLAYGTSLLLLYGILGTAVATQNRGLTLALVPASAAFHAVEYLAIVTYYTQRRAEQTATDGGESPLRAMARWWWLTLLAFVVGVGVLAVVVEAGAKALWFAANLWMAFVHYAYDGLIWRLGQKSTAAALGLKSDPGKA